MKFTISVVALFASAAAVSAAPALNRNGDGTWYDISVGYTACGNLHQNSDHVVAVPPALYDSTAIDGNPNHNTICGRRIRINGKGAPGPIIAKVVDRCAGCSPGDIDMTPGLFKKVVGPLAIGRSPITWEFV